MPLRPFTAAWDYLPDWLARHVTCAELFVCRWTTEARHAGGDQRRKLLTAEDNPEVRAVDSGGGIFKYADGISVVRSRKNFRRRTSWLATFWEALMARAGKRRQYRYFVGGKPEVLAQEATADAVERSILWVAKDGYFLRRSSVRRYLRVSMPAARKLSPSRWDRQNRNCSCAIVGKCIPMRYKGGGWAVPMMLSVGHVKRAPKNKRRQNLGLEWLYRLLSQPKRITRQDAFAALPSLALYWRSLTLPSDDLSSGLCFGGAAHLHKYT